MAQSCDNQRKKKKEREKKGEKRGKRREKKERKEDFFMELHVPEYKQARGARFYVDMELRPTFCKYGLNCLTAQRTIRDLNQLDTLQVLRLVLRFLF